MSVTVAQGQTVIVVCPEDDTELVVIPIDNGIVKRYPGEMITNILAPGVYATRFYCTTCKREYFE